MVHLTSSLLFWNVRHTYRVRGKIPKPETFFRRTPWHRMSSVLRNRSRNCWTILRPSVEKGLLFEAWARRRKPQIERQLRITRLEGALVPFGTQYENFVENLAKMNIMLDRKILADLAIWEPRTFRSMVTLVAQKSDMEGETTPDMKATRLFPTDSVLVRKCLEF